MLEAADAALVIGDPALYFESAGIARLDLGEEWLALTGRPFVFAFWAGRAGRSDAGGRGPAAGRPRAGRAELASIASSYNGRRRPCAGQRGLPAGEHRVRAGRGRAGGPVRVLPAGPRPGPDPQRAGAEVPWPIPEAVEDKVLAGERLSRDEGVALLRGGELLELGMLADAVRRRLHPEGVVTYIIDRNINYTNVCTAQCAFCAFYRDLPSKEGYLLTKAQLAEKIEETLALGGNQILLQGGLHPDLGIEFYEELFRWIKATYPIWIHGLSPAEVKHICRVSKLSTRTALTRLWPRASTPFPAAAPRSSRTGCEAPSGPGRVPPPTGSR